MQNQQKLSELEQLINTSGIFPAIDLLQEKLQTYQYTSEVKGYRYSIQHEIKCLNNEICDLINQLQYLIDLSAAWESIE